jgi:hypothetical protein
MSSRLFHVIVICGAAMGAATTGCSPSKQSDPQTTASIQNKPARKDPDPADRCRLPDGECNEHCRPLASGECLDPCFVHGDSCNTVCIQPDGSCGWPPTK